MARKDLADKAQTANVEARRDAAQRTRHHITQPTCRADPVHELLHRSVRIAFARRAIQILVRPVRQVACKLTMAAVEEGPFEVARIELAGPVSRLGIQCRPSLSRRMQSRQRFGNRLERKRRVLSTRAEDISRNRALTVAGAPCNQ